MVQKLRPRRQLHVSFDVWDCLVSENCDAHDICDEALNYVMILYWFLIFCEKNIVLMMKTGCWTVGGTLSWRICGCAEGNQKHAVLQIFS